MTTTETAAPTPDATTAAARRPMAEDDLLSFVWLADPQVSPQGDRIAFVRVHVDRDADDYRTAIWLSEAGGEPRALTYGERDRQPRWSPDGRTLAFVRTPEAGKDSEIWLLPLAGGEPRRLVALKGGVSSPAWSPDGKRIAFSSGFHAAKDEPASPKPKHEPGRIVTKPVFRENDSGFIDFDHLPHVWIVDVEGAGGSASKPGVSPAGSEAPKPRALTAGKFSEHGPRFSADGKRVCFVSDRRDEPWFGSDENVLYAVPADLAEPTTGDAMQVVCDPRGGIAAWTEGPGGKLALIAALTPPTPRTYDQPTLLVADGPGAPLRDLGVATSTLFGDDVGSDQHPPRGGGEVPLAFAEGGKAVLARVCRHGSAWLGRVDLATGAIEPVTPERQDLVAGTASADGRHWALVIGTPDTPGDLFAFDATKRALERRHAPNDAFLSGVALGRTEEFWCDAFDGRKLQGWIMTPPDFDPAKKYPLVLEIHGGPHAAYGFSCFHEFHHLAGAGYVVLFMNPRGSTSYGQEFADIIQYKYPGDDVLDILACVDHVIARGFVDEKRLGITGGSGGGLLTNWIIAHTHRFAAAVTQRCVADWASMWYSSDFALFSTHWFRKPPFEDPNEYAERSPAALIPRIETPLMVIHSEEDWRTPIHEGEVMFRGLKRRRKPTVMIRFPGESHELSRSGMPSRRVQNQHHIRAWFDHYLFGKPTPEYEV